MKNSILFLTPADKQDTKLYRFISVLCVKTYWTRGLSVASVSI